MKTILCNDRLDVVIGYSDTVRSVRCTLEPHARDVWHRGCEGTSWKSTAADLMCQVRVEDDSSGGLLSYTCFRPTPCDVPGHTDFLPQGQGNDEGTSNMGGQAHATASVDEDGTATATATAPEGGDTSADESNTEDTQGETASADESSDDSGKE